MKSPRDLLLEQHRAQSPALDQIRRQVIAQELPVNHSSVLAGLRVWLSFNRAAWCSLAAVWVVIIALNISANSGDGSGVVVRSRADAREVLEGLRQYQTQLAQLLSDQRPAEENNQIAEPKTSGPRSEAMRPRRNAQIQSTTLFA